MNVIAEVLGIALAAAPWLPPLSQLLWGRLTA